MQSHRMLAAGLITAFGLQFTPASAQSLTGLKSGEQITGETKQCYYQVMGSPYTLTVGSHEICPLTVKVPLIPDIKSMPSVFHPGHVLANKTGERTTGMTKQCFYSYGGSTYTKTVGFSQFCPLSIQIRP